MALAPRVVLVAVSLAAGCGAGVRESATTTPPPSVSPIPTDVVGLTSRAAIEGALPAWREAIASAEPDADTILALTSVPPGAEVDVFLGTWCGDSRREVSRLFVALERAAASGPLPFTVRFIGVDRAKVAPGLSEDAALRYVPTIIVRREGVEVGRVVEHATRVVEQDLLDLLTGRRTGWLSLTRTP